MFIPENTIQNAIDLIINTRDFCGNEKQAGVNPRHCFQHSERGHKMTYLKDLIRNTLALTYELKDQELIEIMEDAMQEIERLEPED